MIRFPITSLGPGERVAIWVNGCSHGCYNCIAANMWDFDPKYDMSIKDIINETIKYRENTRSITITGGDPFFQEDLPLLLQELKKIGYDDILVYTGFLYEEILANTNMKKSLKYIDVLVDGKYIDKLNDNKPLRGSSNQRIIFLNKNKIPLYANQLKKERKFQVEVKDNKLEIYGIPPKGYKEEINNNIKNNEIILSLSNFKKINK